jgi:Fur family iron response transcriptional regulator
MEKHAHRQMVSSHQLAGLMKSRDILPTRQRLLIAQVLFSRVEHLSADQVMYHVNNGKDHVSKATIYNTLGLFARKGLIREVIVDPARVFYDPNTSDHHHFYNIDTGELRDIDGAELAIETLPELPDGTVADGVDVIIRLRNAEAAQ